MAVGAGYARGDGAVEGVAVGVGAVVVAPAAGEDVHLGPRSLVSVRLKSSEKITPVVVPSIACATARAPTIRRGHGRSSASSWEIASHLQCSGLTLDHRS